MKRLCLSALVQIHQLQPAMEFPLCRYTFSIVKSVTTFGAICMHFDGSWVVFEHPVCIWDCPSINLTHGCHGHALVGRSKLARGCIGLHPWSVPESEWAVPESENPWSLHLFLRAIAPRVPNGISDCKIKQCTSEVHATEWFGREYCNPPSFHLLG